MEASYKQENVLWMYLFVVIVIVIIIIIESFYYHPNILNPYMYTPGVTNNILQPSYSAM